ncbi:hypothetical protein [Mucilaginibacter jinjuensis]|uniref:Lipoprotein n=1 Tax=Mucilaginibacter jinjuensis TaxID=1176721 RepID=A0ABY7T4F5_9SPHI|nr:hypothetical protein [Mucilaginibacter jinjuensis]WCT11169.1 hypothetical protein PQO05_20735 [Mucilaginibacter jinjuensis]
MKRQLKFKLIFSILIFLLISSALILGCKKEISSTQSEAVSVKRTDAELIADAKAYFEKEIDIVQDDKTNATANAVKTLRQKLNKKTVFKNAFTEEMPIGKIVTVPVSYDDKELYVGNRNNFAKLSASTFLITYTDKNKRKQVELVTKIPDQEFLNDTTKALKFWYRKC